MRECALARVSSSLIFYRFPGAHTTAVASLKANLLIRLAGSRTVAAFPVLLICTSPEESLTSAEHIGRHTCACNEAMAQLEPAASVGARL